MPLSIALLVLVAALCHAIWNVILKAQPDQFSGLFAQLAAVSLLGAAGAIGYGPLPREVWIWLAAAVAIHFVYHCFLIGSYRHGDISLVYPILRGGAPPVAVFMGFVYLQESPSPAMLAGIMIVSAGILCMVRVRRGNGKAIMLALATALSIACYSVVDAQGVRLADNPLQYLSWLMMFDALVFMPLVLWGGRGKRLAVLPRRCWLLGAAGGLLSVLAYGLVLYAYTKAQVGAVAALRETSVVLGALMGMVFLKEEKSIVRFIGAAVIVAGIALIIV